MTDTTPRKDVVDLQDPLPESNWFWRRVFVFAATAAVMWMVWGAITRLGASAMLRPELGVPALLTLCKWLLGMIALMATYYMVAPSAEQIVKMLKTAALLRSGVQVAGSHTEDPISGKVETVKTVGRPQEGGNPAPGTQIPPPPRPVPPEADDGPPWAPPARPQR